MSKATKRRLRELEDRCEQMLSLAADAAAVRKQAAGRVQRAAVARSAADERALAKQAAADEVAVYAAQSLAALGRHGELAMLPETLRGGR